MKLPPIDTTPKPPISLDDERDRRQRLLSALPKKHYTEGCDHYRKGTKIDARKRSVTCGKCGKELDPYDVLNEIAGWSESWRAASSAMKQAKKDAEFWTAEAKKAKARFNQATRKLPGIERDEVRRDAEGRMYLNRQKP